MLADRLFAPDPGGAFPEIDSLAWSLTIGVVLLMGAVAWSFARIKRRQQQMELAFRRQEAAHQQEINDIQNRFLTNLTHEFRTPLTLILTPTEQLLAEAADEHQRKRLTSIYRNAHHLLRLVNQLLDLSKIKTGSLTVHLTEGNLSEFISQTVQSFQAAAEQRGLHLAYQGCLKNQYIFDAESTGKITYNLITNALKFTRPGGQITVDLQEQTEGIRLTVTDTGVGIPPAKLPNIFERFYQVDGSSTRPHTGTGIGLSLANELVRLLNGRITVVSEEGRGTTFEVTLPFQPMGVPEEN
ncbi:HAMP domain-containing histidine kinase [Spirosoma taeanense]|uniref:histidine kinase n=1 Tax=Spirosoma taeanense TaxID=2735870 RepID=A0A6M5Y099_9BACT|nr:HAMP domain-containing sensor histidine kinase [Spirosoma taeanense]QJW88207.1 HAMP domain-containing histidine kinase [Spirosoma taeanense]